ncbi:hypothetical protein FKP32DRAFT_1604972, partial [Trametes sanguinea]
MDRVISALSVLLGLDRDMTLCDHLVDRAERVFNCSDLDPRLVERFRARLARAVLEVRRLSNEANASRLAMFDHIAMNLRVAFRRSPPSEHHSARLRLVCADLDDVREVVRQERDGIQELAASTSDMEAYAGTLRALTVDTDDVDTNDNWAVARAPNVVARCFLDVQIDATFPASSTSPCLIYQAWGFEDFAAALSLSPRPCCTSPHSLASSLPSPCRFLLCTMSTAYDAYQDRIAARAEELASLSPEERAKMITTARATIMAQLNEEESHDVPAYADYAERALAALLDLEALGAPSRLIEHAELTLVHFLGDYVQPAYAVDPVFEEWRLNEAATKLLARRDAAVLRLGRGDRVPPP